MPAGPAAPLFNAPPRFTVDTATGQVINLHNLMNHWEFLGYGLLAVLIASLVSYPIAMNYAHKAAAGGFCTAASALTWACSSWATTLPC